MRDGRLRRRLTDRSKEALGSLLSHSSTLSCDGRRGTVESIMINLQAFEIHSNV